MRRGLLAALAAAVLVLPGCSSGGVTTTSSSHVAVDTPQLRALKKQAGVEPCRPGSARPVDGGLPDVTLPCLGGGPAVDLASLRGPLVVNLWGSWCGPCRQEMPVLQQFYQRYGHRVGVLGVDYQDAQTVGAFDLVKQAGVTYPLVADVDGTLQGKPPFPGRIGLPLFALVDAQGRVTLAAGGVDSVAELKDLVAKDLGVQL